MLGQSANEILSELYRRLSHAAVLQLSPCPQTLVPSETQSLQRGRGLERIWRLVNGNLHQTPKP